MTLIKNDERYEENLVYRRKIVNMMVKKGNKENREERKYIHVCICICMCLCIYKRKIGKDE